MKQGDRLTLDIIDYGSNGEGIAKVDGFVVFVPFSIIGEKVNARITYVKKNFANAVLENVIIPSPNRVKPPCNRFTRCGGCDMLHMSYDEQLKLKHNAVVNTFCRNTNGEYNIEPCVPSPLVLGYRNKVSLPFGIVDGRVALGFYREGTHKIVSITKCFLQGEWIEPIIDSVLSYATELSLTVYDELSGEGLLRHLVVRKMDNFYTITVVATAKLPKIELLIKKLDCFIKGQYALYLNVNKRKGNTVLSGDITLLHGDKHAVSVRGIEVEVNPFSFFQVNDGVRNLIYDKVEQIIGERDGTVVIDAYAGVGVLGANLAKKQKRVYNIEIVPEAVEDAKRLTAVNDLDRYVTSMCGDSQELIPRLIDNLTADINKCAVHSMKLLSPYFLSIKEGRKRYELRLNDTKRQSIKVGDTVCFNDLGSGEQLLTVVRAKHIYSDFKELFEDLGTKACGFDDEIDTTLAAQTMNEIYSQEEIDKYGAVAIEIEPITPNIIAILDPPRKGADIHVLDAIKNSGIDKIIYISCNPATLSRDTEILSTDYRAVSITPYDMFPNTRHVEVLAVFERK